MLRTQRGIWLVRNISLKVLRRLVWTGRRKKNVCLECDDDGWITEPIHLCGKGVATHRLFVRCPGSCACMYTIKCSPCCRRAVWEAMHVCRPFYVHEHTHAPDIAVQCCVRTLNDRCWATFIRWKYWTTKKNTITQCWCYFVVISCVCVSVRVSSACAACIKSGSLMRYSAVMGTTNKALEVVAPSFRPPGLFGLCSRGDNLSRVRKRHQHPSHAIRRSRIVYNRTLCCIENTCDSLCNICLRECVMSRNSHHLNMARYSQ